MSTGKFTVWALTPTAPNWIDWCEVGKTDSLEEARSVGAKCGYKCWGIRKTSEVKPSYVCGGLDDGRWLK